MATQQVAESRAAEMLEEMIKSTHHLDEILQRMCAADTLDPEQTKSHDEIVDESDTEFQDCVDAPGEEVKEVSPELYFETVMKAFRAAGGGKIEIPSSAVDIEKLSDSLGGALSVRFASCTRDTSFTFPLLLPTPSDKSFDVISSPVLESNVSYSYFISRLRQQIVACDHIVPVERADKAAQLAFLLLEEQQRRLLGAISNRFPYQRESVYWVQSNRVCEVTVQEAERDNQWGLQLKLHVSSHLRARTDSDDSNRQNPSDSSDAGLSSCTRCLVFLPKTCYLDKDATFLTSIAVELALHASEKEKCSSQESSNGSREHFEDQSASVHTFDSTQLPEMLTVLRWGSHDENPVLDNQNSAQPVNRANTFTKVDIETPFPRNRIVQAACSRFHTLFLNDMGLVFSYGHTLDGALGLGYELSGYVAQPSLVDYFFDNLIVVQDISCGGDQLVGAHSAAVSQDGELYTWGVGIALGRGTLRSASTPQRITLPSVETNVNGATSTVGSVSCGSGFCVALTREGHAFSWGKWSDGRLGLGRIPIIARTSRRHGGGAVRKQFQSFQLTPRQIQSIHTGQVNSARHEDPLLSKVSCGDAHCVGLTRAGTLVTWGRGNSGQQGRGDVSDALTPTAVFKEYVHKQWRDVAAGENWSMGLSVDGQVWTWGACGGAVLGHGLYGSQKNALLAETILQRHQRLLSQRKKSSMASSSCPRLPQLKWMTPQRMPCFATPDMRICWVSAGAQHAAAISDTGDLYMWGEGYADDSDSLVLSSLPKLVNSGQRKMAVVNVEDSYAAIVRVLRFIYYDQVALQQLKRNEETDADVSDQLLEDLVAADKYGLERMKRLCEHAIALNTANCLEVLIVAELVHAAHLKQVAMRYIQTNLSDVTARREEFQRFQEDFPQLLEELYTSLRDASRDEYLLREWHTEVGTSLAAQREEQELQWGKKSDTATFPWVPLSLTVAFGTMYLSMMHAQEHEFSAVPATNLVAIAAIGGAIMMGYL
ncbi:hypothetical protein PPTG_11981 [Phytophthora nicotianae INRA-310]|uniref:RCC1-like domain-containing protein n=1 Tax=Phytophthora nicotianae (strain INRA-310) TaxID=761204 RepID=W2Q4P3_PHYN3|nr:hypothetical protein PPTG_11981 [Phytophthora nicotianae INRA-310]ETN08117.1 hypothetical protein PPTG_11981 [Phytophthora nicotianae INRA-310]